MRIIRVFLSAYVRPRKTISGDFGDNRLLQRYEPIRTQAPAFTDLIITAITFYAHFIAGDQIAGPPLSDAKASQGSADQQLIIFKCVLSEYLGDLKDAFFVGDGRMNYIRVPSYPTQTTFHLVDSLVNQKFIASRVPVKRKSRRRIFDYIRLECAAPALSSLVPPGKPSAKLIKIVQLADKIPSSPNDLALALDEKLIL